jgi:hypothetical protein
MDKIQESFKGVSFGVSGSKALLDKQIHDDENVLITVQGKYEDKIGVFSATDKRLIFAGKFFLGSVVKEVDYQKLTSIKLETGLINAKIILEYSGGDITISQIDKTVAPELVEVVKSKQVQISTLDNSMLTTPSSNADLFEKLKKLGELKNSGILTDEEFQAQKQKLLEG